MVAVPTSVLIQLNASAHGGVETHVYYLARLLADAGAKVILMSLRQFALNSEWTDDLLARGVEIVSPPAIPKRLPGFIRLALGAASAARRLGCRKVDFAVGQSHGGSYAWLRRFVKPGGLCVWQELWYGVPTRADRYEVESKQPPPTRLSCRMRFMISRMDCILSPCQRATRNLKDVQGVRAPIFEIAPLDRITAFPARDRTYDADSTLRIGLVARLGYGKGVASLLRVWPNLTLGKAELHFFGPDEGGRCERLARDQGLGGTVFFHGVFARTELAGILEALDLGLMLSFEEGYGLSVWEYMACGLPFVMTDVGASYEFTSQNPDGLCVPASLDGIKAGLELMAQRLRSGLTSRTRLQALHSAAFSYERTARQYLDFFLNRSSVHEQRTITTG